MGLLASNGSWLELCVCRRIYIDMMCCVVDDGFGDVEEDEAEVELQKALQRYGECNNSVLCVCVGGGG